jgi:hypothetical protein
MKSKKEIQNSSKNIRLTEIFITILPVLRDLIPLFLERLSEIYGKPTLQKLQKENEKLKEEINQIEKKLQWFLFFIIIQTLFIFIIFIYILIRI